MLLGVSFIDYLLNLVAVDIARSLFSGPGVVTLADQVKKGWEDDGLPGALHLIRKTHHHPSLAWLAIECLGVLAGGGVIDSLNVAITAFSEVINGIIDDSDHLPILHQAISFQGVLNITCFLISGFLTALRFTGVTFCSVLLPLLDTT